MAIYVPIWVLPSPCKAKNKLWISLPTTFFNIYSYMPTRTREVICTFFKIFDRNVKLYQPTEMCSKRALHNLVT